MRVTHLLDTYISPKNTDTAKAIIIFVHGDGPMNYQAEGYYPLIWNRLRKLGYAIFSWDKPGIGNSTGHWLNQSMADRQSEVHAAIKFIQKKFHHSSNIGLLGFSQAGWVIPAVAKDNENVSFAIGIGFAMNWLEQSWYLTKNALPLKEKTNEKLQRHTNSIFMK